MTIVSFTHRPFPATTSLTQGSPPAQAQPWDLRAVQGLNHLFQDITQPVGLVAMGMGSAAFRAGKLFAQGGLFSGAGWSARLGTSLFGLGTESLVFTEVGHAYSHIIGQGQGNTAGQWARQYGETALLLGSLRSVGFGSFALGRWAHGGKLLISPMLKGLYQQGGMYGGILLGHGMLEDFESPEAHLIRSLGYLAQFNFGGILARRAVGRFLEPAETAMEARIRRNETALNEILQPQFAGAGLGAGRGESGIQIFYSKGLKDPPIASPQRLHPTPMGMASAPGGGALADYSAKVRLAQAGKIRELLPRGRVDRSDVEKDEWTTHFLDAYGITTHPMDLAMFRAGFSLGQNGTELPRRLAWDVDEVQLHWSLNPVDMFRGLFRGRHDVPFQNTPRELFDYLPFEPSPEVSLKWPLRFWYHGVQRLAPSRMRQTIQFHPGGRALLLGIQSSASRPLNLVTTGPAGRLLVLVNEDPALKQIYFGKFPTETVTIEEIRNAPNIYTREDLVNALRILEQGEVELLRDPLVQDYIKKIKAYPKQVEKLKHPALAKILQKNSFNILVDDSDATYRMLGDVPGFTVLKPPSARPKAMLNMALGSRRLHLDRMANGSFEELARLLASEQGGRSREIPVGNLSGDYPLQRFVLELPWARYRHEYALPGAELEFLSGKIAGTVLPEPMQHPNQTYLIGDNGYSFKEPGRRVVVLGDGSGDRTYQLAKAGHYPTVIDWDSEALPMFQRSFRRVNQIDIRQGKFNRDVLARWINGDWYSTRTDAHAVEVFYPFSVVPFIEASEKVATEYVRKFMEGALHSKLRPEGGSVYLVTEVLPLVEIMEAIVRQDPSLELIDMELYEHHRPPIRGGHGSTMKSGDEETSWIHYVKKPK